MTPNSQLCKVKRENKTDNPSGLGLNDGWRLFYNSVYYTFVIRMTTEAQKFQINK